MATKVCIACQVEKDEEDFGWNSKPKGIRQRKCRECSNAYNRAYYTNKDRHKQAARVKQRKLTIAQKYQEWKSTQRCLVCGEAATECLDLHHTDPSTKEHTIGNLSSVGSWSTLQKEIAKCVVICANCHRKVHAGTITLP